MHTSNYPQRHLRSVPDGIAFTVFALVASIFGYVLYCVAAGVRPLSPHAAHAGAFAAGSLWFMLARGLWVAKRAEEPGRQPPRVDMFFVGLMSLVFLGLGVFLGVEAEGWAAAWKPSLLVAGCLLVEIGSVLAARVFLVEAVGEWMKNRCGFTVRGRR